MLCRYCLIVCGSLKSGGTQRWVKQQPLGKLPHLPFGSSLQLECAPEGNHKGRLILTWACFTFTNFSLFKGCSCPSWWAHCFWKQDICRLSFQLHTSKVLLEHVKVQHTEKERFHIFKGLTKYIPTSSKYQSTVTLWNWHSDIQRVTSN